jgi:hypothetical protein
MNRRTLRAILVACAAMVLAPSAHAQVQLLRSVIGSGATAAIGANAAIAGTIGQTIIGRSTSSSHVGFLGFSYTYAYSTGFGAVQEDHYWIMTGASASLQIAPNPVVDNATVTVMLPTTGAVSLKLYNALGQERLTLIDGQRNSGTTTVRLPAADLESGEYTLVLSSGGKRTSSAMRVIK